MKHTCTDYYSYPSYP